MHTDKSTPLPPEFPPPSDWVPIDTQAADLLETCVTLSPAKQAELLEAARHKS